MMDLWMVLDDIIIMGLLAVNGYFLWRIANVLGAFLDMPAQD